MVALPAKTQMMVAIHDSRDGLWESDAVSVVTNDKGDNDYWSNQAKFWLMEMVSNGVIRILDQKEDDKLYGSPTVVSKYACTELGESRIKMILGGRGS